MNEWTFGFFLGVCSSLPLLAAVGPAPLTDPHHLCATPEPTPGVGGWAPPAAVLGGSPMDCGFSTSNPDPQYDPGDLLTITVVVHIIMDTPCVQGEVSDARVISQVEIMNEDFLALAGTNGAGGTDSQIRFVLATVDPAGNPTTGITRDCNTAWYNDTNNYYDSLAWDPAHYLNLYTNSAAGARGYVPFLPAAGNAMVGTRSDRVVINHLAFGRNGPFPPHDQGRTVTHEVGHYLGLFHPYVNGCGVGTPPDCYSTGDLLCDTPPDEMSHDLCPVGATSCGGIPVPIENYMELTDDLCMTGFTLEQTRRMRCTLEHYRTSLTEVGPIPVFADDFESGDTTAWSATDP
ncbi:MAG: zinc metalloprotease [Acidobacteria bacterium]|nr:zinc metalloprotease [Acidobacteriota bacterium]